MAVQVRLKELREAKEISQDKLAKLLDMSLGNVQKIEYGKAKSIPFETLDKLCDVLECDIADLLVRVPDSSGGGKGGKDAIATTPPFEAGDCVRVPAGWRGYVDRVEGDRVHLTLENSLKDDYPARLLELVHKASEAAA